VSTGAAADDSTGSGARGQQVPQITINVLGHAYTVDPLIEAINEAVMQRRVQLTATNTTTGQVMCR
jgi:hypothetical protein